MLLGYEVEEGGAEERLTGMGGGTGTGTVAGAREGVREGWGGRGGIPSEDPDTGIVLEESCLFFPLSKDKLGDSLVEEEEEEEEGRVLCAFNWEAVVEEE